MFRIRVFTKAAILIAVGLIAFTAACGSSNDATQQGAGGAAAGGVATTAAECPTQNTEKFAKTRFVADAALAGGAFKRWIYDPGREGKFKKGTHGRILAIAKAAAAGLFVVNRLKAAQTAAQANPTLCKYLAAPLAKFSNSVTGLVSKAKSGDVSPSDLSSSSNLLNQMHGAANQGGSGFADNPNVTNLTP